MARPQKEGLDYFPLDVNLDMDDKFQLLEAQHGMEGFGIIIKLYMKIYSEGYYYQWGEKESLLFSKRINVDINKINAVINDALRWKILDEGMYDKYKILTSGGIQKRYIEAVKRRQSIDIIGEYVINGNIKGENVNINFINEGNYPQRKEEKRREENNINNYVYEHIKIINKESCVLPNGKIHYLDNKRYGGNGFLVIERAKGICEICGSDNNLCIHHKNGYSNSLENLELLCRSCHRNTEVGNFPINVQQMSSVSKQELDIDLDTDIDIELIPKKEKKFITVQHLSMTKTEYDKLIEAYGKATVDDKIEYSKNYAKLKNYKSLYLTINNWLKADKAKEKPKSMYRALGD